MNAGSLTTAAFLSYGLALVVYGALAVRMVLRWRRSIRATLLLAAVIATAAWAVTGVALGGSPSPARFLLADATDALRYGAWFLFLRNLLRGPAGEEDGTAGESPRWITIPVAAMLVLSVVLSEALPFGNVLDLDPKTQYSLHLGMAVFGLVLAEQLFRRAPSHSRWAIKPLCLALMGIFGFDLYLYADAMLFGRLDPDIWVARGLANSLAVPLVAVATARNTGWTIDMHMSREAVFHSTALLVSGLFLIVVAVGGYFVRYFGGSWGRALQVEFLFAATLIVLVVISSGRIRSRLRVFVSKHFFSYRYDYRKEWLRFTKTLSTEGSLQRVQERAIMSLADLVESPAGLLWSAEEGRGFVPTARWNMPAHDAVEPFDGSLAMFLARTGWVVSLPEWRAEPTRYAGLTVPEWLQHMNGAWLVVPLISGSDLIGFGVLTTPRTPVEVDWEVRDLLKTASRQAASYLGQNEANEALLEARKFDAFNRMSAFVVHDLKNLIAQLSLMLKNAERHRDNPEFQRDMLSTVEHVVGRMNHLMLQLRTGATPVDKPRPVALDAVIRRVCSAKGAMRPAISLALEPGVLAWGHEERLEHVVGHLIQNALDASRGDDAVEVRLQQNDGFAIIEVKDSGVGMTQEFIRERLFKPFETTKKAGMGIGVYESSQYVAQLGGRITIDSKPGAGTRVRVMLPVAETTSETAAPVRVAS